MTTSAELEARRDAIVNTMNAATERTAFSVLVKSAPDLGKLSYDAITALRAAEDELARVNAALIEFNAGMQKIGGCTDGGCRIIKPTGMHTNGGCRCFRNEIKMQHYIHFTQQLVAAIKEHPHV